MLTDTITITEFEPSHQPYFEQLYREWFTGHFRMAPEPIDMLLLNQPEKTVLEKGGAILTAIGEETPTGFVALKKADSYSYELTKMVIHPEQRGKGLGEALCRAAIDKARSLGAKRIVLYSHSTLQAALHLYSKLGFVDIPLEEGHYSSFRCDTKMEKWIDERHSRIDEVDWDQLELGRYTSDHMLVADYADGQWQTAEIRPFGAFSMPPTSLAFHYGQTIFEGMKAFRMENGKVQIFRPDKHYDRFVLSAERMCMPVISRSTFREGLRRLVGLDRDWVPDKPGSSLYIRPMIIATDTLLRLKISETYRFAVVCLPASPYFAHPIRIKVERQFVRAARGGTGYAKCGGNYAAAFYPTRKAQEEGYDQVLWTDGRDHIYVEEAGMMNVMFVIDNTLVTPPLSDSILDGITRDSLLTLAADAGIAVEERPVSVEELKKGLEKGRISEAFGAGTAAVISPIQAIGIDGRDYALPNSSNIADTLKTTLDDIRYGRKPDPYNWNFIV
ncbi:MAG TPA: branched-chain amino acid aminotransferase [Puia sp.]|nr:branched-chain amino acid aminotransferase [Puia sp.]